MRNIFWVSLSSLLVVTACDPAEIEKTGIFAVMGPDEDSSKAWLVPDRQNIGAGPAMLGNLAGMFEEARYVIGQQRTAYLFGGDLRKGISSGACSTLAAYDPGSPDTVDYEGLTWMTVPSTPPHDWNSWRVYDSGECSAMLAWEQELLPDLLPAFGKVFVAQLDAILARCSKPKTERFARQGDATFTPVLRAKPGGEGGALGIDDDVIRVEARYKAESVAGCAPVVLDISFEVGYRYDPEGNIVGYVGNTWAEVEDFCLWESQIEDQANELIQSKAVPALEHALRDRLLIDPRLFGFDAADIPSCSGDDDCAEAYTEFGTGHRCHKEVGEDEGECHLQIEADRVNVRPEGLEVVLAEDAEDPQRALLNGSGPGAEVLEAFLCSPDRLGGLTHPYDRTPCSLGPFTVPEGDTPDDICG